MSTLQEVREMHERIGERRKRIESGSMPVLWVFGRRRLSHEEILQETSGLILDHEQLLCRLLACRDQIAGHFDSVRERSTARLLDLLDECQTTAATVVTYGDSYDDYVATRIARVRSFVAMLARAALWLVRKVDAYELAIQKLCDNEELQREVLARLNARLQKEHERRTADLMIKRLGEGVRKYTVDVQEWARELEAFLGPLAAIAEETMRIDAELIGAMTEIERLSLKLADDRVALDDLESDPLVRAIVSMEMTKGDLEEISRPSEDGDRDFIEHLKSSDVDIGTMIAHVRAIAAEVGRS